MAILKKKINDIEVKGLGLDLFSFVVFFLFPPKLGQGHKYCHYHTRCFLMDSSHKFSVLMSFFIFNPGLPTII